MKKCEEQTAQLRELVERLTSSPERKRTLQGTAPLTPEHARARAVTNNAEDEGDGVIIDKLCFSASTFPEFYLPPPSQPFDLSFQPNHGYWLALTCALVYGTTDQIDKVTVRIPGLSESRVFEDHVSNTRALVLVLHQCVIVAWRGTANEENWNTNLNCSMLSLPQDLLDSAARSYDSELLAAIRVHKGFLDAFQTVQRDLLAYVDLHAKQKLLYLTGHSLGGALALINYLFFMLKPRPCRLHGFYTYGPPKAGNTALKEFLLATGSCRLQRVCNRSDIVPALPPKRPYGFRSMGILVFIDHSGRLLYGSSKQGSNALHRVKKGLHDHRIINYVQSLRTHADEASIVDDRLPSFKLSLTAYRASSQPPKVPCYLTARIPRSSFCARTIKMSAGPICVWDERLEIPQVCVGDEIVVEVHDSSSNASIAQTRITVADPVVNSQFTEFLLQSPSGPQSGSAGVVSLGFAYSPYGTPDHLAALSSRPRLFGVSLSALMSQQQHLNVDLDIPVFLAACSEAILLQCLHVRGGFLLQHQQSQDSAYGLLKTLINTEESPSFRSKDPPQYILGLFLDWIAALPSPLFGQHNYDLAISELRASESPSPEQLQAVLASAVSRLDDLNRRVLAVVCAICEQVVQNAPVNRCPAPVVAEHLGRQIIRTWHPQTREPIEIADDAQLIGLLMGAMISGWRTVFAQDEGAVFPQRLTLKTFDDQGSLNLSFRYSLIPSSEQDIYGLSKVVLNKTELYITVLIGAEVQFLNMRTHRFESSLSLAEVVEVSNPPSLQAICHRNRMHPVQQPMGAGQASARCIGLWEIGRSPLSSALHASSTWVLAFDSNTSVFALPTETGMKVRPLNVPGPFSCGTLTPVALLLGRFDGTVVMLELSSFQWKTVVADPAHSPIVCLSPYVRDSCAVWAFKENGTIQIITLDTQLDETPRVFSLPIVHDAEVLDCLKVGADTMLVSVRGGHLMAFNTSTLNLSHHHQAAVDQVSLANLTENHFIMGFADGRAQIWDITTFRCCGEVAPVSDPILSIVVAKPNAYSSEIWAWLASTKNISIWKVIL